jgi:hypothetical protein
MNPLTIDQLRQEFAERVAAQAWEDIALRQALLHNPRAVLHERYGLAIDPALEIVVLEETPATVYLVLPGEQGGQADSAVPAWRREAEAEVVARAARDAEFRRALLRHPRATLEQAFEVKLPPAVDIVALEEHGARRYLVLPAAPAAPPEPYLLAEEELLEVAGGGRTYRPENLNNCIQYPCGCCCSQDTTKCCDSRGAPRAYASLAVRRHLAGPGRC